MTSKSENNELNDIEPSKMMSSMIVSSKTNDITEGEFRKSEKNDELNESELRKQ